MLKINNEKISIENMDREVAILIYKGKLYEDIDHQCALKGALIEEGKKLDFDLNNEDDYDKAADHTQALFKDENEDVYGFDIFMDRKSKYFVSHFQDNMEKCINQVLDYVKGKDLILGTFTDSGLHFNLIEINLDNVA